MVAEQMQEAVTQPHTEMNGAVAPHAIDDGRRRPEMRSVGRPVLVHCGAAVGRSCISFLFVILASTLKTKSGPEVA